MACLPGRGWLNGGCLILADALVLWADGPLQQGGALRRIRHKVYLDHAFAWGEYAGRRWLIDGDGLQDEARMRRKLGNEAEKGPITFSYRACAHLAVGFVPNRSTAQEISYMLRRRFGAFRIALLQE